MNEWISVKDQMPEQKGTYLVYAPTYRGGSSSGLDSVNGIMFSRYRNRKWSIELGYYKRPNCVTHWMPLKEPPKENTERDICRAALEKWGTQSQIIMVFEEMSELQKELCKNARDADNIEHIAEKIADVQIMLEQMIILYKCEQEVINIKKKKLERLYWRIIENEDY